MIPVVTALVLARSRARLWLARDSFDALVARVAVPVTRPPVAPLEMVCAAIARAEAVVDRVPGVGRTCMHRAIGRLAALRRAGLPAQLFLGVRQDADLIGHAWVEVDGAAVMEREPPRYTVTFQSDALPRSRGAAGAA